MAARRKYPDEVRDRAIRLVRDLVDNGEDSITVIGAYRRVGEQLGLNTDTLRTGASQALIDDGERPGLTTSGRARLVGLEREVRKLSGRGNTRHRQVRPLCPKLRRPDGSSVARRLIG